VGSLITGGKAAVVEEDPLEGKEIEAAETIEVAAADANVELGAALWLEKLVIVDEQRCQ
jgi:hypothetical protein